MNQIIDNARSTGSRVGHFVSSNALPLTALGVGLGLIAWSWRREVQRQRVTLPPARTSEPARIPAYLQARKPAMPSAPARRQPIASTNDPAAMTTTGAKLMGVRARNPDLDAH